MIKVWYFLRLPANRFKSYHLVAVSVLSLSLDRVVVSGNLDLCAKTGGHIRIH